MQNVLSFVTLNGTDCTQVSYLAPVGTNRLSDIGHGSCLLTSPESQGQRVTGNVQPAVTQ